MIPFDIKTYLSQPNPTKKNVTEAIKIMCEEGLVFNETGFLYSKDYLAFMRFLIENYDKDTDHIKSYVYGIIVNSYNIVYLKYLSEMGIVLKKEQCIYILHNIIEAYKPYYRLEMETNQIEDIVYAIRALKITDFRVFENYIDNIYDLYNFVRIFETAGISIPEKDINVFFIKALERNEYHIFGKHKSIINFIQHLISKYNLDVRSKLPRTENETLLHLCVYNGDFDLFMVLYPKSNLNAKDTEGYTAVDRVIEDNIVNLVENHEPTMFYNFLIKNKAISDIAAASVLKRTTRIPLEVKIRIAGYLGGFGKSSNFTYSLVEFGKKIPLGCTHGLSTKLEHVRSKKGKGWDKISKKLNRSKMPKKHFLIPSEKKFPVYTQSGKLSCKAIQSAILRSRMLYGKTRDIKYKKVLNKALKLLKQFKCNKV